MIRVYTDGSCEGGKGRGGWASLIVRPDGKENLLVGKELQTTSNRMELVGVIAALMALPLGSEVTVFTDSQYVKQGIDDNLPNWVQDGWMTAQRKPLKNRDLWMRIDGLLSLHQVAVEWIRGHDGHPENERVNAIAQAVRQGKGFSPSPAVADRK